MDDLARLVNSRNNSRPCPRCGTKLSYISVHGTFKCKNCDYSELDTYGQMKVLLSEHPNLSKAEISQALGIPLREINRYIINGVLENPSGNIA